MYIAEPQAGKHLQSPPQAVHSQISLLCQTTAIYLIIAYVLTDNLSSQI